MAFQKGKKKTGGRKPGTANKRNIVLQEAFAKVLTPEIAEKLISNAIASAVKGKPGLLLGLMPYGLQEMPRAIELSGGEEPIEFTFNLAPDAKG